MGDLVPAGGTGTRWVRFAAPTVAAVVWFLLPRPHKRGLAVRAVLALALTAGLLHDDPRPFAVDPLSPALFRHAADNGFPSDHTAYAAAVSQLVLTVRRRIGLVLFACSVIGGSARVAATVHQQDIVAGLLVAVAAVALTALVCSFVDRRRSAARDHGPAVPVA
ncbi:phosphatase PAP2 family protein [Lapillicoccus sp.]|uniref:phosphatase PAP2 family protein n=1 Tax=Lapillicoccus sp. TaxID=1909287 RepID=UPI003266F7F4